MSEIQLNESVKSAINCLISSENYETPPEIDVVQGSEAGDGYSSKTYAISIKGKNRKDLHLFVKYVPEDYNAAWKNEVAYSFQTELRFYQEIYPTFHRFEEDKSIKEPFDNVPKYCGRNINNCEYPPIILENLRSLGYTLRDRKKPVDDDHLKLPIKAFARYHAISYALKDQRPEELQKLTPGLKDVIAEGFTKWGMDKMVGKCVDQFLESLDPVSDTKFLNNCKNLTAIVTEHAARVPEMVDEYAVLGQGDCWSNNMMFLYDKETGLPIDVKLIDWQCVRVNSPLIDFSYFFYTLATKEALDNVDYYLNLYYDTLSQRIIELGSDPKKLFPYDVFIEHWRKFSLFGLAMAFFIVKIRLFEKDEVPDFISASEPSLESFAVVVKEQDKYISQMRDIVEHFIDRGLLQH